jgi:hypothetical protein
MTKALDKGYNEGRPAFRRYFAKYGPNVRQSDPRMPRNPYVGVYGFQWLNGFESELRRPPRLVQARIDSPTSRSNPAFVERRVKSFLLVGHREAARRPF